MSNLAEAQARLKAVEEKMEVLQAQYLEAMGKKEGLAKQVSRQLCLSTLCAWSHMVCVCVCVFQRD
jgi:hypothetical protein